MNKPIRPDSISELINAIFAKGEVNVYEAYSAYDSDLRQFKNANAVIDYIKENQSNECSKKLIYVSLHYTNTQGFIEKKRITLHSKKVNGATFRYTINGWGLIQFQLSVMDNGFTCHLGVNSEKRAYGWQDVYPEMKSPSLWDWKAVESHHRRLQRVLKSCYL